MDETLNIRTKALNGEYVYVVPGEYDWNDDDQSNKWFKFKNKPPIHILTSDPKNIKNINDITSPGLYILIKPGYDFDGTFPSFISTSSPDDVWLEVEGDPDEGSKRNAKQTITLGSKIAIRTSDYNFNWSEWKEFDLEESAKAQVQTDWNETDPNNVAYLKNKPPIGVINVGNGTLNFDDYTQIGEYIITSASTFENAPSFLFGNARCWLEVEKTVGDNQIYQYITLANRIAYRTNSWFSGWTPWTEIDLTKIGSGTGSGGVSPTIEITPIENGHKVSITDVNGEKSFDVENGESPEIGANGNWYVGDEDTGVNASGVVPPPIKEKVTISSSMWSELSNSQPFFYETKVQLGTPLNDEARVSIANTDPVFFANFGLALAKIEGQELTIYATNVPVGDNIITILIDTKPKGRDVEITVPTDKWSSIINSQPFMYKAIVTVPGGIGDGAIVTLINDNPVLFATYGLVLASATNKEVTLYATALPVGELTLTINLEG